MRLNELKTIQVSLNIGQTNRMLWKITLKETKYLGINLDSKLKWKKNSYKKQVNQIQKVRLLLVNILIVIY